MNDILSIFTTRRAAGIAAILLVQILCPFPSGLAVASSWYVAPTGDDSAAGTLEKPFATVRRAQESAAPGDTVYLRGGVYKMTPEHITQKKGIFGRVTVLNKSGKPEQPITYRPYENEAPVFDYSAIKLTDVRCTAFYVSGSWIHLVGLDITGVQVGKMEHTQSICVESQGSHNVFERLALHDGQAIGIYHVRGSDNLFLNCDAWNNWDYTSENGKGENTDGFGCHPTKGSTGNVFRGCRAWFNSDDGYDCISASEAVRFENCWAAYNGYSTKFESLANGNGFKAGGYGSHAANELPNPIPRHVVQQCVAVRNKASGFYANHHPGGCDWINNTAFRNGTNFNMQGRLADNRTEIEGYDHRLFRNLSYKSRRDITNFNAAKCEAVDNSFTLGLKLTDQDFVGLDEAELLKPRKSDGSLPDIGLMRPTPDSVLARTPVASTPAGAAHIGAFGQK